MNLYTRPKRNKFKEFALWFGFFVLAAALFFFIANLDLRPAPKNPEAGIANSDNNLTQLDEQIKSRIGATEVSMADGSSLSYSAWAKLYGLTEKDGGLDQDPDGSGLPNYLKYVYLTNPLNADPNKKGYTDKQDVTDGYDPTGLKGTRPQVFISIDKSGVNVPMIWSAKSDEQSLDKDLEKGVVHYPGTGIPGQPGNVVISGHSSNYIWAAGSYNHIFATLNNLSPGDIIHVKFIEHNGRVIIFSYKVTDKKIVGPDDQGVFQPTAASTLSLATCWPVGTNLKRLIVTADLI